MTGSESRGSGKERRLDPQITVGLLADATGFPLMVRAFEGNKVETKTMLPVITRVHDRASDHRRDRDRRRRDDLGGQPGRHRRGRPVFHPRHENHPTCHIKPSLRKSRGGSLSAKPKPIPGKCYRTPDRPVLF